MPYPRPATLRSRFGRGWSSERSNNALHLTPPPPCPQRVRVAVQAVSQVSFAVRPQGVAGNRELGHMTEELTDINEKLKALIADQNAHIRLVIQTGHDETGMVATTDG